jgi:hypothetical protein
MSKDMKFQEDLYETLRVAAGVRKTPEGRTLVTEIDHHIESTGLYEIIFHEVYREPKTGNPFEDGCRAKLYEYVGRLEVSGLAELFHEMAEAKGKIDMDNVIKVGDRVEVVALEESVLEEENIRNPIGKLGTVVALYKGEEFAPYEVVLDEDEPDGATDAVTLSTVYPDLYAREELRKL